MDWENALNYSQKKKNEICVFRLFLVNCIKR